RSMVRISYAPPAYTLIAARDPRAPIDVAGLSAVMPLTPVETSVIWTRSPVVTSRRYRLLAPLRSETKYTRAPSGDQCGSMFLAPDGVDAPPSGRIAPLSRSTVAS